MLRLSTIVQIASWFSFFTDNIKRDCDSENNAAVQDLLMLRKHPNQPFQYSDSASATPSRLQKHHELMQQIHHE